MCISVKLKSFFFFSLLFFCEYSYCQQTYTSGALLGELNVTDQGAVVYNIPIKMAPGTAGLTPKLSLTYSSHGSNGILGVGWTLQGLSQITEGKPTVAQDNNDTLKYIAGNINNVGAKSVDGLPSWRPRLYLDGERMVLAEEPIVNDTFNLKYGKGKRSYYTEQFNFSKISVTETYGDDNESGSPLAFKVKSKDGLIWQYGTDDNSRLAPQQNALANTWLVSKINDTKGNYIKYNYGKYDTKEIYPSSIEYTGNDQTGLQPYNRVEFIYESRPDNIFQFAIFKGYQTQISQRLKEIHVFYENKLFKKYILSYVQSSLNDNSLIQSITEFDSNNVCFKPLLFEYTDNNLINFSKNSVLKIPPPLPNSGLTYPGALDNQLIQGDWDHNGVIDFLAYSPSLKKYQFYIQDTKLDTIYAIDYQGLNLSVLGPSTKIDIYPFDVESDGQTDLLIVNADSGTSRILPNSTFRDPGGTGTSQYYLNFGTSGSNDFLLPKTVLKDNRFLPAFTDWNKDGITDIIFFNYKAYTQQPTFYFIKNKSISHIYGVSKKLQTEQRNLEIPLTLGHDYLFSFNDLSNDGLPDILAWDKTSKDFRVFYKGSDTGVIYNEGQAILATFNGAPTTTVFLTDDFNNDGIVDIFIYDISTGNNKLIIRNLNGGSGANAYINPVNIFYLKDARSVTNCDLNANGLTDLLVTSNTNLYHLKDILNYEPALTFPDIDNADIVLRGPGILGRFTKKGPVDLFFYNNLNNKSAFYSLDGANRNALSKITNSNKATTDIEYTDLLDGDNNDIDFASPPYPLCVIFAGISVPNKIKISDGLGGKNIIKYNYLAPYFNMEGRGFRGFARVDIIDSTRKVKTIKQFNLEGLRQTDPKTAANIGKYGGSPLQFSKVVSIDPSTFNMELTSEDFTSEYKTYFQKSSFSYTKKSITRVYETFNGWDGTDVSASVKRVSYDDFGNVLWQVTDYLDGQIDSVVNVYNNDLDNWYLGRLLKSSVYFFKPGKQTIIRSTEFEYDFLSGQLIKEIIYPDSSSLYKMSKEYIYDDLGNVIRSQETAWNGVTTETRIIETTYDPYGRFVISTKNALNQIQTKEFDARIGKPIKVTSPNNIINTFEFDNLGRPKQETSPDGNWTRIRYLDASDTSNVPSNCQYLDIKESSNYPPQYNYYDELNRLIKTVTIGYNGKRIVKTITFDTRGYLISETEPFFESDAGSATSIQYTYDYRGRLSRVDRPFKNTTAHEIIQYNNKQKVLLNSIGQLKAENYDNKEQLIEVIDNADKHLKFDYTASGALEKTTDPAGNNIQYKFDFRGKKISSKDPDMGEYKYSYNGFGEIIQQINPKGDTTAIKYDKLGRVIEKKQKEGIISFIYDSRPKGVGKLATINGINGYTYEVFYDSFGRNSKEKETIAGKDFESTVFYNALGKQSKIIYPGGFAVDFSYDNAGFLFKIYRQSDNYTIWNALKISAKGQLEQYTLGNKTSVNRYIDYKGNVLDSSIIRKQNGTKLQTFGYQFNSAGQLTQRSNVLRGKVEEFTYDNLNRLILSKLNLTDSVSLRYDELGNILTKSDVGTYVYGNVNNGPHQLKEILVKDKVCLPGYDVITQYNSFNKVTKIEKDSLRLEVYYNAMEQRCMQKMYISDSLVKTKYYVSNSYEYTVVADTITEANFIRDYEGVVAVYYNNNKMGTSFQYLHKDHIGSTTLITDSLANVVAELSYDAWGKRRKLDWSYNTDSSLSILYQRGFTGHEHYDYFDIIDMNGRIYDPVLGRFLSPDPVITDGINLQSYNRYSYVINNPLTLTDPSGFSWLGDIIGDVGSAIGSAISWAGNAVVDAHVFAANKAWEYRKEIAIAIIIAVCPAGGSLLLSMAYGAAAGFATGFAGTLIDGGSFSDALKAGAVGAVVGAVSGGIGYGFSATFTSMGADGLTKIGGNILSSGVRNGFSESLQGGTFEHGFMQGVKQGAIQQGAQAATSGIGDLGGSNHQTNMGNVVFKSVGHGIVQGISAELSGGSFKDGFITGAAVSASQLIINDVNPSYRAIASGLVGGTASELSGGKFSNGAASGMMIRMYNDDNELKRSVQKAELKFWKFIYKSFYGNNNMENNRKVLDDAKKFNERNMETNIKDAEQFNNLNL